MGDNKKNISIKTKLIFMLSLSAFIAIAMTSAVLFWYKYNQNKAQAVETLSQTVGIMGENLSASIEFDDAESAKTILSALKINNDIDGAYILKDKNTPFAAYIRSGVDEKALKQKISSLYHGEGNKNDIKQIDFDNIVVSKPIYLKGKYLASFLIVSNTKSIKNTLQTQLHIQLTTLVVVLFIIILLAFRLQRIFTLPIFKLKAAMDDVRVRGNLDTHIDFSSNDEFQSLVDGFEGMLETIRGQKLQLEQHAETLNETIKIKIADIEHQKNKLQEQLLEIQRFQNLTAGREARMVELKEMVNTLYGKQNLPLPFNKLDESAEIVEDEAKDAKINLLEVIDLPSLQKLLDHFCNSVEIASAIIDMDGNILAASRWQKACTDFHRQNEKSCANCIESDVGLSQNLKGGENFSIYKCKNGLVDCASPIIIDGKHVANVFIGQFLTAKPDMEYFANQARSFGYDEGEYIDAIKQVPIVDEQKLPDILGFLSGFTRLVTSLSLEKIRAKKVEENNHKAKLAALNLAEDANSAKNELIKHQEHLEELIVERTKDLDDERHFVNSVMNSQTNIVITTNGEVLKTANKALFDFFEISSVDEFLSKYGKCICDTFKLCETDEYLQKMVDDQKWIDFVCDNPSKLHKAVIEKNGEKHIFTVSADRFSFKDEELGVVVFTDITELEKIREEIERILENILLPVLITSKKDRVILYANKYAQIQYEKSINELVGSNIDDIYTMENQYRHIVDALSNYGKVENFEEVFKTATGKEFIALLSVTPIIYNNEEAYIGMVTDITKQKEAENEIRRLHKHTKESIEYASLIQHSLIPSGDAIRAHFGEYFVIWHPKDIVGGDIYFFEDLGDGQECILFVVDCTGHGVPGAFVSMLVKAIERQVTSQIRLRNEIVSPAGLLAVFNKSMKNLLKQENDEAISNAGFDGAIIYHNKQTGVLKFAGAQTPLFYVEDGEFKTIKGDRQSIGYKKSDGNFEFTEHVIKTKPGMCFYIATDGYLDQNGGEKGFPFGKKRFGAIIEKYHMESFADQQEIFLDELHAYQKDEVRNDDITLIGFRI